MIVMKPLILPVYSLLILFSAYSSCTHKPTETNHSNNNSQNPIVNEVVEKTSVLADTFNKAEYQVIGREAVQKRVRWKNQFILANTNQQGQILTSVRQYLYHILTEDVFPAWYGTPWDFNGHVYYPHEGKIACGYFVSTTLKHIGFPLNRYRVAQQDATTIIKLLASDIRRFQSLSDLLQYISQFRNEIFIVGLDNHVGFLVRDEEESWFVHASYGNPAEVVKENAAKSRILSWSSAYILGSLLTDDHLRKYWLEQQPIVVRK